MNIFYYLSVILLLGIKKTNSIKTYSYCEKDRIYCDNRIQCISTNWVCDGEVDCGDESDEDNCDGNVAENLQKLAGNLDKLRAWIHMQRRPNWGWGKDTSRAIVALALSYDFDLNDLKIQLMCKQMKFELLQTLIRKDGKITRDYEYEIASYVHSLLAMCSNPRNFQGFNLVKMLEESLDRSESINPMVALALCNCNNSLKATHISKLIEIVFKESLPHLLELQAYALMALSCLKTITSFNMNLTENTPHDESIKSLNLTEISEKFTKLQNKDGSFGNIYTTALLIHAFNSIESSTDAKIEWDLFKALEYLTSHQEENGSFGDMFLSYLMSPLMNGKTFTNLREMNCTVKDSDYENTTFQEELDSRIVDKHHVQYFIFTGEDKDISFGLSLRVPIDSTFYDVMRLAAQLDPRFRFEYTQHPRGIYVYSLFGIVNNPESGSYWRIYKSVGNSSFLSIQQSPDQIIPKDDDAYIFWYKFLT